MWCTHPLFILGQETLTNKYLNFYEILLTDSYQSIKMRNMKRTFPLVLITILAISSLSLTVLAIKPVNAQSTADLYIPEFTVQIVTHPYDVQPSQSIDPYTGKTTNQNGYHVENKTIEMKIKNQVVSNNTYLYFGIREKGHFGQTWNTNTGENSPKPSNSDYTVLSFPIVYPPNSQVDYQVETFVGYNIYQPPTGGTPFGSGWHFTIVQESGWSNIETLNLTDGSVSIMPSVNPTPTLTPTVPELSWLAIIPLMVSILFIAITVRHRKNQ
jgi:hypothetical protein